MALNMSLKEALTLEVKKFLDAANCAMRYEISKRHWLRLVDAGKAPQPTRLGRSVRWKISTLEKWDADGNPVVRHVPARATSR